MESINFEGEFELFDDDSTRERIRFMSRLECMLDDMRNPDLGKINDDENFEFGKRYRIKIQIEEV